MKILLIQPPLKLFRFEIPSVVPPLGLAYIAAVLEQEHDVAILDAVVEGRQHSCGDMVHLGLTFDEIYREIKKQSPDIVGIGCLFSSQYEAAMRIAEIAKKHNTKVIIGGSHPSSQPEETMQDKNIDFIVLGEGEETSKQLINAIKNGKSLEKIDGIAYRKHGKIKVNPRKTWIKNLDSLPLPARHLLNMKKYFASKTSHGPELMRTPYTSMITSRGCPFNCVFCSIHTIWGRAWRPRKPEKVVDEIEFLINEYGIREVHFEDDNISLDRKRMAKICDEIAARKLDIKWTTPNGIALWTLDRQLLKKMKRSGCYKLCFGIESGDPETLKFIRKPLTLDMARRVIKETNNAGIWTHGFFVFGFPFETRQAVMNTLRFAKQSGLDFASFMIATPYPGTDLYKIMQNEGMIKKPDWSELRVMKSSFNTKHLSASVIDAMQKSMYRDFFAHRLFSYTNPIHAAVRLKRIKSKDDLYLMYRFAKRFTQIMKK